MNDVTGLALFALGWWTSRRTGKRLLPWTVVKVADESSVPEIEVKS